MYEYPSVWLITIESLQLTTGYTEHDILVKIVYFCLMRPITLSTLILTFAIDCVSSTSKGVSYSFPHVNVGRFSLSWQIPQNQQHQIFCLPIKHHNVIILQCSVRYLSLKPPLIPEKLEAHTCRCLGVDS